MIRDTIVLLSRWKQNWFYLAVPMCREGLAWARAFATLARVRHDCDANITSRIPRRSTQREPVCAPMKRKRPGCSDPDGRGKRNRPEPDQGQTPDRALLRQYYASVSTLRHYLASRLTKASHRRRREILRYGRAGAGIEDHNEDLASLLDNTTVGTSSHGDPCPDVDLDKDIMIFTQQVANSTVDITPTQGAHKQSEVGRPCGCRILLYSSLLLPISHGR